MDRHKFRPLLLPALGALGVARGQTFYAMLPPAGYLLADLHGKLRAVLGRAGAKRVPAFAARAAARPALPAGARMRLGLCGCWEGACGW